MPTLPETSRFSELLNEMHDIYERKNSGYAGQDSFDPFANFRMSEKLGISAFKGCLVRMSDKFVRICNLTRDETNNKVNESITDTLIDLAVYSLIAICLFEEKTSKIYNEPQKEKNVKYPTSILGKTVRIVDGGTDLGTAEVVATNSQRVLVKFKDSENKFNVSWDSIVMED